MKRRRRRKCLHCGKLFCPDPRNVRHQRYCSEGPCRQASKAASQRRWLSKRPNQNYFCGPENVRRVQAWRQANPGYWRRGGSQSTSALQDDSLGQVFELNDETSDLAVTALQDLLVQQEVVLIGLIAFLTGTALQDDIAEIGERLIALGGDILNPQGGQHVDQTTFMSGPGPPSAGSIQLDRSAPGS